MPFRALRTILTDHSEQLIAADFRLMLQPAKPKPAAADSAESRELATIAPDAARFTRECD